MKKFKQNNEGSILILTMLALVGALSIAVAMSSIAIVERKITTKSRKSVTAFQSASAGLEWAMKKINDASGVSGITGVNDGKTIKEVFGVGAMDSDGKIKCVKNIFSSSSKANCEVYLLKSVAGKKAVITNEDEEMNNIIAIRSTGTLGSDREEVGRALEAYAMPNCGSNMKRIGDFCVDQDVSSDSTDWSEAVSLCAESGKRLCTATELVAATTLSASSGGVAGIGNDDEWTADVIGDGSTVAIIKDDGALSSASNSSEDNHYRCCRNR